MPAILTAALHDVYDDLNGSRLVAYTPLGGATVTVQAQPREQVETFETFGAGAQRTGTLWSVQQDDVPTEPVEGSLLLDDDRLFKVRLAREDIYRSQWILDCDEIVIVLTPSTSQVEQLWFLIARY